MDQWGLLYTTIILKTLERYGKFITENVRYFVIECCILGPQIGTVNHLLVSMSFFPLHFCGVYIPNHLVLHVIFYHHPCILQTLQLNLSATVWI